MGRTELIDVLTMEPCMWGNSSVEQKERHAHYVYAAELICGLDKAMAEMLKRQTELQKLLSEYACLTRAGKNDPRVLNALSFSDEVEWQD